MMRAAVLFLLLAATAAAQPSVTPEVVLYSTSLPAAINGLSAAGGADAQLVIWSQYDVTGIRWMRAGGTQVFTAPLIEPGFSRAVSPAIARVGDIFFVAWIDSRPGVSPHLAMNEIRVVRTDLDGHPLDAAPIALGPAFPMSSIFVRASADRLHVYNAPFEWQVRRDGTVAVNGRTQLVFPAQTAASNGKSVVYAATELGPIGVVFGFAPFLFVQSQPIGTIGPQSGNQDLVVIRNSVLPLVRPAVATDGRRYLLAWRSGGAVMSQPLDEDGKLLSVPGTISSEAVPQALPNGLPLGLAAAWDGSQYVVAWDGMQTSDIFGVTISEANELTARFNITNSADVERNPVLVPLGDGQSMVFYAKTNADRTEIVSRIITTRGRARRVR